MKQGCIFCAIAAGVESAARIAEDEHAVAFLDLFPVAEGHALVIPRAHAENIFEIDERSMAAVASLQRRVAHALRKWRRPDGLGVYQANGAAAGQTVFHYHVHLLPRKQGEPMTFHGRAQADRDQLARMAREIAAALE